MMMTSPQHRKGRPTLGFFLRDFEASYMQHVWLGVIEGVRKHDANLICFKGGDVAPATQTTGRSANIVYSLAKAHKLDGIVVMGLISADLEIEEFRQFCDSYRPLPVITIGTQVPGIPNVGVDNVSGIYEAMRHLIEHHGYQRIGFIKGPEGNYEAELRYRAYTDALSTHGIALDPALVLPSDFRYSSGKQAVEYLFSKGDPQLDALVAANDLSALGALDAFFGMGIRVPYDVALVGFDDIQETRIVSPPLTTIRQPKRELGMRAAEHLLAMIAGEQVPENDVLPTTLVTRQSCGCMEPVLAHLIAVSTENSAEAEPSLENRRENLLAVLRQSLEETGDQYAPEQLGGFIDVFLQEAAEPGTTAFVSVLQELLRQNLRGGRSIVSWQQALSRLRQIMLGWQNTREIQIRLETLFQQARVLIGETVLQFQGNFLLKPRNIRSNLRVLARNLGGTFDIDRVRKTLTTALQQLEIPNCYLIVYDDPEVPLNRAEIIFAYVDHAEISFDEALFQNKASFEKEVSFSTTEVLSEGIQVPDRSICYVVEALYVHNDQVGFGLFEIGPQEGLVYEVLRTQLSSSLRGAVLLQRQQQAQNILELQPVIHQVLTVLEHLASTSESLTQISSEMASGAEEVSQQVASVSESSQHISDVIQGVSAAATQEAVSITEISETVEQVMEFVTRAVESATTTNSTMTSLATSSQQVGEILNVITGVAKQIKFLSLYAAIVASQSGNFEANFTVVANEIKTLAQETSNSAKDIAQKTRMIQMSGHESVEAISRVVASIHQVSEHSSVISTAITEQSTTAGQISRTIADAAEQSGAITHTTGEVALVAQQSSDRAARVQQAAQNLAVLAEKLQDLVTQFTAVSEAV